MAIPVLMPKQGITVESCFLGKWYVNENDMVSVGTLLFNYETDKAVFDYVSEVEGRILKILYAAGDIVDVLQPVCYVGETGEKLDVNIPETKIEVSVEASLKANVQSETTSAQPIVNVLSDDVYASPRAKAKALKQNIDLSSIKGSGPDGRIIDRDVSLENVGHAVRLPEDSLSFTIKPLSHMRKIIGNTMMKSLQNIAQLTHSLSFDATDIFAFRKTLKQHEALPRITFNDILIFAVSRVIRNHMNLNAHFVDGQLKIFDHVHVGIATDTPRGLMVPTLQNADVLTLAEISIQTKALISQCVAGQINPDLLTNASFTISNLGMLDIEHFTPIINPPQTGILGINNVSTKVKTDDYGRYVFYQAMGLSLTYDHQVLDGADASRFLKELKEYLQDFAKHIKSDSKGLV